MNGNIYKSISQRTEGNIYIGVIGPVRTGKSTFIKKFMELLVLPNIENKNIKNRILDQLPQSGDGKTITTTEPKFVPEDGAEIHLSNGTSMKIRLVDCVGFLVPGVYGHKENDVPRMVKTPWDMEDIPFDKAAEIGTEKVMCDHSTVGLIITSDGSATDIPRVDLIEAEKKAVNKMRELGKPFIVILNTTNENAVRTLELADELSSLYEVAVIPCNIEKMSIDSIEYIFENLLGEFPVTEINIDLPGYLEALGREHPIKQNLIEVIQNWMNCVDSIGSMHKSLGMFENCELIRSVKITDSDISTGKIALEVIMRDGLYYDIIEELMNHKVRNDKELFMLLKDYAKAKAAYVHLSQALEDVETKGYGIVKPDLAEMVLRTPEVFKHGNKYGVRLKAKASCLHIIRTDISTEVSPVVGNEQQSNDLAQYLMNQFGDEENKIWDTNLFGKTLEELVVEQMQMKISSIPETLQNKVIKSLQKISDEGKDYFICIIL